MNAISFLPKRATIALILTAAALALLLNFKTPETTTTAPLIAANVGTATSNGATTAGLTTTQATTTTTSSGLKDGTYTGNAAAFRFGTVQVQVTIASGKIANVNILQYPSNDPHSSQIAQSSLPTLIAATLQAQSASINSVSGATYTSQGYKQSLQSALVQANA